METSKISLLKHAGTMRDLLDSFDWCTTSLGDIKLWSPALRNSVILCMHSPSPMLILVGETFITIYNDAYKQIIGNKHPTSFCRSIKEIWPEVWDIINPMLNDVIHNGNSFAFENHPSILNRNGYQEQCYFTFSFSPIYNDNEQIEGVFGSVTETTKLVRQEEILKDLRNKQLKNLFTQAPIAMCILTGPTLVVEVANEKMLDLWGKSANQILDRPLFEGLADAKNQGFEDLLASVYNTGNRVVLNEIPVNLLRKGKTENVFVKLVYEPLREQDGSIAAIMVLADDITEQVANRKKVEESEARLRLAVESTKLGTWDFNPTTGELNWSDECRKIYSFPLNGKIDYKLFSELIFPADKAIVEREIQNAMSPHGQGTYDLQYRIHRFSDKSVRWIHATGKVFFDAQKQAQRFIGTAIDITEQKTFEETLRQSEMQVRLAIEASEMGTYEWDIINSKFLYSDRLAHIFGFAETKGLLQKSFSDRIHAEDRALRLKAHELAFQTGTLFYEARVVWPDNSIHWVRLNGKIVYDEYGTPAKMYGTTLEITEQKIQAEMLERQIAERTAKLEEKNVSLKKSEERYHKMIEEVQDYAIILMDKNGIIQNWNKGAEKIKQYSEQEIIGRHFSVFYLPEDQRTNLPQQLINLAVETGRAAQEGWRKRKDGSRFWGSITITALHGENNEIIGFSKVTRDLTDKKAWEDKLLQYTVELESQNKELEQFAYVASHDLQEPLRKIQTFAEIIQTNLNDESLVTTYFSKINNSAKRMRELIKAVLNYSKLGRDGNEMVDTDLNLIVSNVKSDFELLIEEKNAEITYDRLPVIKGNPLQLGQLFANLISNSLKFTDKPSALITIKSKVVSKQQIINNPSYLTDEKYVEITITDNGIGFDQQYEKLIFTMFQRLHGRHQYTGTGIGLALCKKIVDNHKGYITAKGALEKGSTFYVYLPWTPV